LFAGYATFTAFGAAVAGYLAAGGALQNFAVWWTQHGKAEAMRPSGTLKIRETIQRLLHLPGRQPRAGDPVAAARHEAHEQQEALEWAARRSPITIKAASGLIAMPFSSAWSASARR
jgi:hypothetical protein